MIDSAERLSEDNVLEKFGVLEVCGNIMSDSLRCWAMVFDRFACRAASSGLGVCYYFTADTVIYGDGVATLYGKRVVCIRSQEAIMLALPSLTWGIR